MLKDKEEKLVEITVCVGSSCHIKGSRKLIEQFSSLIKEYKLEDRVLLKGSFCLEHCGDGFNWKIGEKIFTCKDVKEAEDIFRQKVVKPLLGTD